MADSSKQNSVRDPTGGHESVEDEERLGSAVDLHRLLRRLNRGKKWVLGAFLVGAMISVPVAKWGIKRTYRAVAMLQYDGFPPTPAEGDTDRNVGGMLQELFVPDVLNRIGDDMGYDMAPHFIGRFIEVEADPANVVRITGSETDPESAARLANAAATQFLVAREDTERARIQTVLESARERLEASTQSTQAAQQRYDTFRERHGIADLTTEQEAAIEAAAELRAQRDRAESDIAVLEARTEQLQRELRRTPRTTTSSATVTDSPESQELARLRSQLAEARASLADSHPRVQALQQQIRALQARITSGAATKVRTSTSNTSSQYTSLSAALSSANADLEATRQRLEGLTTQAAEAQARVEQFSSLEGDASQILSEVRVNQQLSADIQAQVARLEDAVSNPVAGFSIMSEATPPASAEASKKKYIVAAGIPLGCVVLVLVVMLGFELKGLKIRTASEAAFWGRAPVIGTSIWPRDPQAIDDLIADMDDFVPEAHGQMLVVAAVESDLAQQFAARLNSDWHDTTLVGSPLFDDDDQPIRPSLPPGRTSPSGPPLPDEGSTRERRDTLVTGASAIVAQSADFARYQDSTRAPARAHHLDIQAPMQLQVEAWEGPADGPALRRAARLADRVCVILQAGEVSFSQLSQLRTRLGRSSGIGIIVVNMETAYAGLDDRIGPVEAFWAATRD